LKRTGKRKNRKGRTTKERSVVVRHRKIRSHPKGNIVMKIKKLRALIGDWNRNVL
jgi:spore cortex formation protein SpoVR/YcgB (stage V sporulation)